jgi:hypothetical protein
MCQALLAGATVGWLQNVGRWGVAVALGLAALVLVDLRWAWAIQLADAHDAVGAYQLQQVELAAYYAPTPAVVFLRSAAASDQARSIGYAQHVFGGPIPYTLRWTDPKIAALNVNNRAVIAGLNDIQGYNPIHLARLEPFMRALNGQAQEYHQNDVVQTGLDSPLLDVLGCDTSSCPSFRPVLTDDPDLALQAGKRVEFELIYTLLALQGVWDETPVINPIRARQFGLLVLQEPLDAPPRPLLSAHLTDKVRTALRDAYVPVSQIGGY